MLIIKGGKGKTKEGIEQLNQKRIKTVGENKNMYLGILELVAIRQAEMKGKIRKEYFRRKRKLLEITFNSINLIIGMNTPGQ